MRGAIYITWSCKDGAAPLISCQALKYAAGDIANHEMEKANIDDAIPMADVRCRIHVHNSRYGAGKRGRESHGQVFPSPQSLT